AVGEDGAPGLRIWMRTSADGTSFSDPFAIDAKADGVLETTGIAAHVDRFRGTIFVGYLTAGRRGWPEVRLLSSTDGGATFASKVIEGAVKHDVPPRARPGLSQDLVTGRSTGEPHTMVTWDTYARVFWSRIDPHSNTRPSVPIEPRFDRPLHRARAVGLASGTEYLLAWLERPVGDKTAPPMVAWQVWFIDGLVPLGWGEAPEAAGASTPAVFANQGKGFTILY